jgi:hypothetical protein
MNEVVTYRSEAEAQQDMLTREAQGWEVVSATQSGGVSGGCIGCLGFIPIFIPFGGKPKYKVTYRRAS